METYIALDEARQLVKIGRSVEANHRISTISKMIGEPLLTLAVFDEDRELEFHLRFKMLRRHGEWFFAAPQLINAIFREKPPHGWFADKRTLQRCSLPALCSARAIAIELGIKIQTFNLMVDAGVLPGDFIQFTSRTVRWKTAEIIAALTAGGYD